MTPQNPPNLSAGAILLRQIGEALYGPTWQADLSRAISVSDRSMRRWAAGTDEIPDGAWRDIHYHAESRWRPIQYFDEEIVARLNKSEELRPIKRGYVVRAFLGLHFALHTNKGRAVRCFISREVFDDRVPREPLALTLGYFKKYAEVFYRIAQQKYDAGEIYEDLITVSNVDVIGENLPDIRCQPNEAAHDRFTVQWSTGLGEWPTRPFYSQGEALAFVKELFTAHGQDGVEINLFLNDAPYIGYRRLCQWDRGMLALA